MAEGLKAGESAFVGGFLAALPDDFVKSEDSNNALFARAIFAGLIAFGKLDAAKGEVRVRVAREDMTGEAIDAGS